MRRKLKILLICFLILKNNIVYASSYGICHQYSVIRGIKIISYIFVIIKILVPVLLIISAIKILSKTIFDNRELKSEAPKLIQKIIISIFIFFVPTIINIFLSYISSYEDSSNYYSDCGLCLTSVKHCDELLVLYPKEEKKPITREKTIIDLSHLKAEAQRLENENVNIKVNENPIEPKSNANIISEGKSNSLKYSIEKVSKSGYGTYYITRIWVLDAYKQLNKFDVPNYGSNLEKPKNILIKGINQKGLANKMFVAFNASGFYLKDTYDSASVNYYSKYNKTSVGTIVITDGTTKRNAYDKYYKTWTIMGINTNNQMILYQDEKAKDNNAKKIQNDSFINTGVRNTFSFASPLVINGKASAITKSMPSASSNLRRQAICQVDANNFILITTDYSNASLNRDKLIKIMLDLNCQTGTNFDGGGSIALMVKKSNSTEVEIITGNKRNLTEVGYFVEQ